MIGHILGLLTVAAYVCAALLQLDLLLRAPALRRDRAALGSLRLGLLCHSALLILLFFSPAAAASALPVDAALYLLWFSWILVGGYLCAPERLRNPLLGAFVSCAGALAFIGSSALVHLERPHMTGAEGAFVFAVHVLPALIAEAGLVFAGAAAGAYLVQDYWLRSKSGKTLRVRGPSLESLAVLTRRATVVGFFMMTLGLLSGIIWAVSRGIPLFRYDPAQWNALLTWISLAWLLHARQYLGWPERRLARATVALTVLLFSTILISLVFSSRGAHGALYS